MIKNFITSTFRALKRQKVYAIINLLGLATGIAVSLMLFLFIEHELGFDQFHDKGDRIFRVVSKYTTNSGRNSRSAISFGSVAPEMKKDIPEVTHATRIYNLGKTDLRSGQTTYHNQHMIYADHDFFDIFSFPSLYGSGIDKVAFDRKGAVISEQLATTLYGNQVPIGQLLTIDGTELKVLDVVKVPKKSHIRFDVVVSLEMVPGLREWAYQSGLDFHSYGLAAPNTDLGLVSQKVSDLYNAQMSQRFADFVTASDNYTQPLADIYLRSEDITSNINQGSMTTIYLLGGIDLLILLIAVINYINLTTAQYEKRTKEIGVRKVIGANRKQLVLQFLSESVILTLSAFVLALGLVQLSFERFGALMQIEAEITYWQQPQILLALLGLVVVLGLLSGLYPALFISRFRPTKILKRDFPGMKRGTRGGKFLVAFQFLIAIVLVTNLMFLRSQINYVKNKDLGFNKEQVLIIDNVSEKQKQAYQSIAATLSTAPGISEVTASQSALGTGTSGQTVYRLGEDGKTSQPIGELRTELNFLNTHNIELINGRDFSADLVTDQEAFIINRSGAEMLFPEGENPIGESIVIAGRTGPIIGVVEDFHYTNLKRKIAPLVLSLNTPYQIEIAIKLNPGQFQESLAHIESALQQVDADYELSYYFMDDYFQNMFEAEERNAALINYSSLIAVLISLVGLIALISHSLSKRVKEVAIRKVLGARFSQLLWVLTREFYWVIILANVLAIPLSVWIIGGWLDAFAYRIDIASHWGLFLGVAVLFFGVSMLLILNQVVRKARMNPAEILVNE